MNDEVLALAARLDALGRTDDDPEDVTAALARIGSPDARATLAEALRSSPSGRVRFFAAEALGRQAAQEHLDAFIEALTDPRYSGWHSGILFWMTHLDCRTQVPLLCEFIVDGEYASVNHAVHALQAMMRWPAPPPLEGVRGGWNILAAARPTEDWRREAREIVRDVLEYLRARARAVRPKGR